MVSLFYIQTTVGPMIVVPDRCCKCCWSFHGPDHQVTAISTIHTGVSACLLSAKVASFHHVESNSVCRRQCWPSVSLLNKHSHKDN